MIRDESNWLLTKDVPCKYKVDICNFNGETVNGLPKMKIAVAFCFFLVSLQQAFTAEPFDRFAQKWVARYNGPSNQNDFSSVVAVDPVGDVYTVGYSMTSKTEADAVLVKYDGTTGAKVWEWHENKPRYDTDESPEILALVARLRVGADGNPVVLLGLQMYKIQGSDGMQLWTKSLPGPSDFSAPYYGIALDAASDIYLCGNDRGTGITSKYSGLTGATLWDRRIYSSLALEAVAVDLDGSVFVTGYELRSRNLYTAKYSALDGSVHWEKRIAAPTWPFNVQLITLDTEKNPVVVVSNGLIMKYSGANGGVLWQRQGPANEYPYDVLCDSEGNVFVASSKSTYTTALGATLSRYARADGVLQWSKGSSSEFYCSLLMRGSEILVAGQWGDDLLLASHDPVSGARRWNVMYGSSNYSSDRMACTYRPNGRIALQPDGGVVITGCSRDVSRSFDFVTLRYAPGPIVKLSRVVWVLQNSACLFTPASGNGVEARLVWEYGPTAAYGHTTAAVKVSPGLDGGTYQTTITGLPENTTFHARAVAMSAAGTTYGEDFVFTTGWDANRNHLPDQWELDKWGNTIARSPSGDDDGDGLPNLLEYAFSQNPVVSNSPGAVPIAQVRDYLTATITKQPFVTYTVEASSDLQSWSTADTTVLVDDATTLTVRGNTPISSGGAQFLRIRVTAQ